MAWAVQILYLLDVKLVGFPGSSVVKKKKKKIHLPMQGTQGMQVQSLDQEDPLEEEMATHSSIPAWIIPWTEEPAGYSLWGCKESDTSEPVSMHATSGPPYVELQLMLKF